MQLKTERNTENKRNKKAARMQATSPLLVRIRSCAATLEDDLAAAMQLNIVLLYDSAVALQGFYPTGLKTYVHTKTRA